MKWLYVYLIFLMAFLACEDSRISKGREAYQNYFLEVLNDPKSLDIISEKYEQIGSSIYWEIDYTAKNKIGEKIRAKDYFLTIEDKYIKYFDSKEEYLERLSNTKSEYKRLTEE